MKRKQSAFYSAVSQIGDGQNIVFERKTIEGHFDLHWHGFFEIEVVLDGEGTQLLNGREYPLKRGCVYLLSPLDFHEVIPRGPVELYNVMFRGSMLSPSFKRMAVEAGTDIIFYFAEEEFCEMVSLCRLLETECRAAAKYREEFVKNLLDCVLIMLLRKRKSEYTTDRAEPDAVQKSLLFLQQHFKENPSLADTARAVNLHANYLSQRFKEVTGQNFTVYLTDLKLAYAKKLLRCSSLSVTEICFSSGFTSLSNFMKVFKEKTGLSPLRYARQNAVTRPE